MKLRKIVTNGNTAVVEPTEIIKSFIRELTNGDLKTSKQLFAKGAVVMAPGGKFTALGFLKNFYADNLQAKAKIINIFSQSLFGNACAAYVQMKEYKEKGIVVVFNCIAIVECSKGKIKKLELIFDTYPIRSKFPGLF